MPIQRTEEEKKCPKCGQVFVCSASARCWCYEIDIPVENLEYIELEYDSCLCPDCLKGFMKTG
jgi:hypothetical protein